MSGRIEPGGTIGILGGGQLGRLLALAAGKMGYRSHIFCPTENCPASQVASAHTCASYDDYDALAQFASSVDVATFEFENVPADTGFQLGNAVPVRPSWKALEIAQDRSKEKAFFTGIGAATAPWRPITNLKELSDASEDLGFPCILKTSRLGYDGKGQIRLEAPSDVAPAWTTLTNGQSDTDKHTPFAILEGFIRFTSEISVIAARGLDGNVQCFEPVDNVHKNHILHTTTAPANIPPATTRTAIDIAERAASALELVGLLAVEMFVTSYGGVLVNEMAPRPHNSGHWTLDACQTDQFTQLVRAICGLPLAEPLRHSNAVMTNLIGDEIYDLDQFHADPSCHVYVYGKETARPGRKMGHVTKLSARND